MFFICFANYLYLCRNKREALALFDSPKHHMDSSRNNVNVCLCVDETIGYG